jgi:hypothetical protein
MFSRSPQNISIYHLLTPNGLGDTTQPYLPEDIIIVSHPSSTEH